MSFLPYGSTSPLGWIGAFGFSAVLHGAAVVALVGYYGNLSGQQEDQTPADFVITLERLDADTLAGFQELAGLAGATGDAAAADAVTASQAEQVAPDTLAAAEPAAQPETPAVPEPPPEEMVATPVEALQPETVAGTVDTTEALAPVTSETLAEDPLTVDPNSADLAAVVPVLPDDSALSPILPDQVETVAAAPAAAPETLRAVGSASAAGAASAGPDVVTAVSRPPPPPPPPSGNSGAGTAAAAAAAAAPSLQDLAIGDLMRRIRAAPADPCLVSLPRRDGEAGVGIALVSAKDTAMETLAKDLLTAADADIRQTRTLVDTRQCAALEFLRKNIDYPATRMGLRIDELEIQSGGRLTGVIRGASGRHLTLLLIDDNGVMQDLQRFLSFSGNLARFDVPVTRAGPSRDTSQILVALGTRLPPLALREKTGHLAEEAFAAFTGDDATSAYIGFATFDVR